jgi:hypothetical protein
MKAHLRKRTKHLLYKLLALENSDIKIDAHILLNDIEQEEVEEFQRKLFTSAAKQ